MKVTKMATESSQSRHWECQISEVDGADLCTDPNEQSPHVLRTYMWGLKSKKVIKSKNESAVSGNVSETSSEIPELDKYRSYECFESTN